MRTITTSIPVTEPSKKMHLRIPNTPITIIGDPCQASSVPLSGHVELACKPSQAATITSIQLALVRTTKIKKQESSSLLPGRRLSFGNSRSPTRDKRTYVEELMQWTIAYSPSHTANTSGSAATPRRGSNDTTPTTTALIPFNIRIPGHLPATTTTPLGSTTYTLTATALTTTPTTPTKNLKTDSPLHLTRALHLPHGPSSVLLRRRFPQSALSTRLTLPGVLRPTAAEFTAHLTLHGTATRHGRTTTHLCVRRLDWRIEEHTLASPSPSSPDSAKPQQKHIRKLAAGKWEGGRSSNKWTGNLEEALPPTRPGAFEDDDNDMAVAFPVSIPASARALCGNGLQQQQQEENGPRLCVSHVLVLELHTVELKYGAETGELVNMYPFPQRKFGAVYDVEVQNWGYDGAAGISGEVVPPPARTTNAAALALAMPCGEVFMGEWPPSYDSVAVM